MQISQFLRAADGAIAHFCPACRALHVLYIDKPHPETGARWAWDGHIVEPSISPSVSFVAMHGKRVVANCHYTLIAGKLQYQSDCTHALRGITMMLPALPDYLRDKCLI